ncbi:hypothetical protein Ddye_004214 [Dipteronia dyeriana]|uniref:Histone-lysine N-methyltransferase SUVR4 n=1 Tax=Dipteronia dyeriana TaxID=168575 RepID=A0AAD9XU73_9ROSI|nr:hypothetical protein Ddye_004214 [Dipteronia dyeriana]
MRETLNFGTTQNVRGKKAAMVDQENGDEISIQRNVLESHRNNHRELLQKGLMQYEPPHGATHSADGTKIPESKDMENKVAGSISESSQVDIASSYNGEVKITLVCDSSRKFDFRRLNIDAVLEVVEENFRERYGITNPEFSIKNLMKEFCQYYLEVAGYFNNDVILLPNSSKKSNSEVPPDDQKHKIPTNVIKKNPTFIEDMTRGEERHPISLVNEDGTLELPKFFYILKNTVYQNAYVNFSLARISDDNCCSSCLGDCLSEPANCACTRETRGKFAYTPGGLLEEKFLDECIAMNKSKTKKDYFYYCENCPLENVVEKKSSQKKRKRSNKYICKGHLMRKFIKECWTKCGCGRNCGNRVVQRGITAKLQVFSTSEGKGWGVRTLQELEKGTFVCEYVGEIVTNMELYERNEERTTNDERHTYPVLLDADWASEGHLKDEEALCLDATSFGNVARFINHRCYDANLIEIPVEVETPDHHYYHIAFFTTRKVKANEELTWDYGIDFDDDTHPIKAFECKCGSHFCGTKNRSYS